MEARGHHQHRRNRFRTSGLFLIARDFAFLCVALNVFALFHHVLPRKLEPVGRNDAPAAIASGASPGQAPHVSASPPEPSVSTPFPGDFSATFPVEDTGRNARYSYQTDTVKIAIDQIQASGVTYFLADVYVKSIDAFQTAFAKGT